MAPERKNDRFPWVLFVLILLQGAWIGLTDDEAYYWVLAQRPSLGYAFHPPAVAWLIALSQALLRPVSGPVVPAWVVRLPAAAGIAVVFGLALAWLREAGALGPREPARRAVAGLLSFAGLFSLSWMMVPDVPLLLGWTCAFVATWRICADPEGSRTAGGEFLLFAGCGLAMLSKYSAVLLAPSIAASLWRWAGPPRRRGALLWAAAGFALGLLPTLVWNAGHGWGALLYQLRERHEGGGVSGIRYLRFWAVEAAAAGPVLIAFFFRLFFRFEGSPGSPALGAERVRRYCLLWALPGAAVFCLQPLFADFKPHWAFVAWWPTLLAFVFFRHRFPASPGWRRAYGAQACYGLALGALVLLSCHLPLTGWALRAWKGGLEGEGKVDPRLDVTNDLYGWRGLRPWLQGKLGPGLAALSVVGSRYQTAGQAAFALGLPLRATLLPRDLKARDEWPDLGVSVGTGPDWPRLKAPVLFVADNRYSAGPEFPGARCGKLGRLEEARLGLPAKWIDVWKCEPGGARP
jgi:hypothetical protein